MVIEVVREGDPRRGHGEVTLNSQVFLQKRKRLMNLLNTNFVSRNEHRYGEIVAFLLGMLSAFWLSLSAPSVRAARPAHFKRTADRHAYIQSGAGADGGLWPVGV